MNVVALVIGGLIGTVMRYELGEIVPVLSGGFPLAILTINLLGCLFLGWFFTVSWGHPAIRPEIRLGLGTGMTGAFTTFSTFSVQTVELIREGHGIIAVLYVLLSIVGGLLLTFAGVRLAKAGVKKEGTGTA